MQWLRICEELRRLMMDEDLRIYITEICVTAFILQIFSCNRSENLDDATQHAPVARNNTAALLTDIETATGSLLIHRGYVCKLLAGQPQKGGKAVSNLKG